MCRTIRHQHCIRQYYENTSKGYNHNMKKYLQHVKRKYDDNDKYNSHCRYFYYEINKMHNFVENNSNIYNDHDLFEGSLHEHLKNKYTVCHDLSNNLSNRMCNKKTLQTRIKQLQRRNDVKKFVGHKKENKYKNIG